MIPGNFFSLQISNRWKLMSKTQVQKESRDEAKKKAAQQSGTALFLLCVLVSVLFPVTF